MADSNGALTFVFTDIAGSTRLLHTLGDEYAAVLVEHQRLLRDAFARHEGREIDTQGDAFFVAFPTPDHAIRSAIEVQQALRNHEWPEGVEVKVRIGMDTGPAAFTHERYTGRAVHRAARVSAAGHGGQILVSDASELLLENRDAFVLRNLGARRLKDIDGRVRIYQVDAPGLERNFPALKTLDVARRRRLQLGVGLTAAAAGIAVAFALVLGRSSPVQVAPNSLGVIQPRNNHVIAQIPVGSMPGSIAAGPGSIWVANVGDKTVSHVDPFTRSLIKTIPVGATPDSVAVGPGAVWVLHGFVGLLTRIDPDVNRVSRTITATRHSLAGAGGAVTVGGGAVWAAFSSADVAKIDPISNRRVAKDYAGRSPDGAAFGEGSLWIANHSENTVDRFDPRTFGTGATAVIKVGRGPGGIAVGGGFVWVSNTDDDSISRIDPSTQSVTPIPVGRAPRGVAYGAGAVWVADSGDGTIKRIDPRSARVEATIHLGNSPSAIAVGQGLVWVTVSARA